MPGDEVDAVQAHLRAGGREDSDVSESGLCRGTGARASQRPLVLREAAVQLRALEEVLDSGFGMQEKDCPLGHIFPEALRISLLPLMW